MMKSLKLFIPGLILSALLIATGSVNGQAKKEYKSLEDALYSYGQLIGHSGPTNLQWINGGNSFSYTQQNPSTQKQEIRSFNTQNLQDQLIFNNGHLNFPDSNQAFSYQSFQWSPDSKHIVFQSNFRKIYRRSGVSDYYVYSLSNKSLKLAARGARTAELSPDGSMVGVERNGNMYAYYFGSKKEVQLTHDAQGNIFNGHFDWVYEEEFGKAQAWNWSPDSRYIAFWQFNESKVPIFQMTNYEGLHPKYVKIPIPQPGDPNPMVKIGVIDIQTGKRIWLNTGEKGDFYIPRIYWTSEPDILAMMILNRTQNDLKLLFFNVKTGKHWQVMEEKNKTWVAIFNFYTGVNDMMFFPKSGQEFFWISDRSGYYQIYRYAYSGKLINQVTHGKWDVIKVMGINEKNQEIYYSSAEASPLEEQFYSIKFNGTEEKRLTPAPGYHQINLSPNQKYYVDSYSNLDTPTQVQLWNTSGHLVKTLEDNQGVRDFMNSHVYFPKSLFHFTTSDGVGLDGSMVKPLNFDSTKKYPVVFTIYGGPESHSVYNSFESSWFTQFLAQHGYIVVDVNNRGSANYGSAFMKVVYLQLGKWESYDFVETAKYLSSLPYVEKNRMAIMGTSYGGYSTIFTMLTHPGVFKVGIANSPVTDWRLYDDIYTERYMGLPAENPNGYFQSSAMNHAEGLTGHLLLIHSTMDDNVHVTNTMQLLTALTNAGKDVDLRIFPPGAHGAAYNFQSYLLEHQVYFQYLERYLKGTCHLPNLNQ
ncbi:MAG: S9 family peptidase [Chitinophagaceae bacterium]